MRFDRGWAYGESCSDVLVIQPLDHQSQHFTFALRQVKTRRWRLIGSLNNTLRGFRGKCGAAGMRRTDGPGKFVRRDILEQIADRSGFQPVLDKLSAFEAGQCNELYLWKLPANGTYRCRSIHFRQNHIHEYHVWQGLGTKLDGYFTAFGFTHQLQILKNLQEGCQAAANH